MQLKLFQYKQVEQPQQEKGVPKRKGCCCGRLFVTACLIALLITFTAFVVPQLYSTVDEDSLDAAFLANRQHVELGAKLDAIDAKIKGQQRKEYDDVLDSASDEIIDLVANAEAKNLQRRDQLVEASDEVVRVKVDFDVLDSVKDGNDDDLDRAELEAVKARFKELREVLGLKPDDDHFLHSPESVKEVEEKMRGEDYQTILQKQAQINGNMMSFDTEEVVDKVASNVEPKEQQKTEKFKEVMELKHDDDKCSGVRSCLVDYYALWDIDASDALPPYVKFFNKLQSNFDKLHEFAIDLICLAQEEVRNCMADELAENSDIDECLSVQGWMENFELKKLDAREYAADFRVRGFECKNEDFLKENFKCLYPTTQTRKDDLDVCSADLKKAIAEHQPVCDAMDDYITCARGIFVEECGPKVSNFVCNIVETSMLFNYPSCRPDFQTCQ